MNKNFILISVFFLSINLPIDIFGQKPIYCPKWDYNKARYKMALFDQKFIKQSMTFEPYTGNASGYTNPLA